MTDDLFTAARRERLKSAGWHREHWPSRDGQTWWRSPDGRELLTEDEALRRVEGEEAKP